jgi:hypothetical protein
MPPHSGKRRPPPTAASRPPHAASVLHGRRRGTIVATRRPPVAAMAARRAAAPSSRASASPRRRVAAPPGQRGQVEAPSPSLRRSIAASSRSAGTASRRAASASLSSPLGRSRLSPRRQPLLHPACPLAGRRDPSCAGGRWRILEPLSRQEQSRRFFFVSGGWGIFSRVPGNPFCLKDGIGCGPTSQGTLFASPTGLVAAPPVRRKWHASGLSCRCKWEGNRPMTTGPRELGPTRH